MSSMAVRNSSAPPSGWVWGIAALVALVVTGCGGGGKAGPPPLRSHWGEPQGARAGRAPRALVMLVHGGGWRGPDPQAYQATAALAPIFEAQGYATLTFDYRTGAEGVADAERFYAAARRRVGAGVPICAYGASAGATIALLLAAHHPEMRCVVALAGPTDLPALAHQPGGATAYAMAVRAFGEANLRRFSPALHASDIKARLLLVAAANDPLVPLAQTAEMAHAVPGTRRIVLPPGDLGARFVHSRVDLAADKRADAAELRFLAAATASGAR